MLEACLSHNTPKFCDISDHSAIAEECFWEGFGCVSEFKRSIRAYDLEEAHEII